ncbi:glycosyltransferase family 2 protein [Paenibacillus solani]|uniref:glycosyltransferase family 2 protein n=1 Tax=Paenibacillus solani TaxID=1705565 RepID=UPI003D2C2F57
MDNGIAIVMPTFNKSSFLDLTLAGFARQSVREFTVVIVDDGSNDKTKDVVSDYQSLLKINYVYQDNKGRSVARNTALKSTDCRNIIFCDDDRIPNEYFVEQHLTYLKKDENTVNIGNKKKILARYHPELVVNNKLLAIILKHIKETDKTIDTPFFDREDIRNRFDDIVEKFSTGSTNDNFFDVLGRHGADLEGFYFPWMLGTTANMSFRRTNIEDYLFDERYQTWGMEDTDFSYMLSKYGFSYRWAEAAVNYHQQHPSNFMKEKENLLKNIRYFCKKYDDLECYLFANLFGIKNISRLEVNELYASLSENHSETGNIKNTLKKLITNTLY